MNIEQAKRAKDVISWWGVALLIWAITGGIYYMLASWLTIQGLFFAVVITSLACLTISLVIFKRCIEGKEAAPESRPYNDFSFIKRDFVKVDGSTIAFQVQDGPIREFGTNGCQVDTIIEVARDIVESFNSRFPCPENDRAIRSLNESIAALAERKKNREKRGVEGHDKL